MPMDEEKRRASEALLRKVVYSSSAEARREALLEVRLLSKWDMENRVCLAEAGAIPVLAELLHSRERKLQENSVTSLLNLSIYPPNKAAIIHALPPILPAVIALLQHGLTSETRSNAAALLYSLLVDDQFRATLGCCPNLIDSLLGLLHDPNTRCKTDSLHALFHLALCASNKVKLVHAGAVPRLLFHLIHSNSVKSTEAVLAVLSQIAACPDGAAALQQASALPVIANLLDKGTPRTQENAAALLLNLCQFGADRPEALLDNHLLLPAVRRLYDNGSPRGKSKAGSLMKLLNVHLPDELDKEADESINENRLKFESLQHHDDQLFFNSTALPQLMYHPQQRKGSLVGV